MQLLDRADLHVLAVLDDDVGLVEHLELRGGILAGVHQDGLLASGFIFA